MMTRVLTFVACVLFAGNVASLLAEDSGIIFGRVTLTGKAPPESPIKLDAFADCKPLHKDPLSTRRYVVDANGGLANVFIYVKDGLGSKKFAPPTTPVVLDQQQCLYHPYVLGIQVGQSLTIKNSDTFMHNVHGGSAGSKNPEFNVGQSSKGMETEKKFTKTEVFFSLKCDVHPWMFAYVGAVDHPFFAVSGTDGNFRISHLPDGEYTLAAVHPKAGEKTAKVKVVGGEVKADFQFEPKAQ